MVRQRQRSTERVRSGPQGIIDIFLHQDPNLGAGEEAVQDVAENIDRFTEVVGQFLNRQDKRVLNAVDTVCGILGSVPALRANAYISAFRAACVAQSIARARARRRR